ncbi:MAG: hypothetical protein HY602_01775 [Parcubacteria group bacterium]|nr:hypothetical protein [Parcubacteria group bacterium]
MRYTFESLIHCGNKTLNSLWTDGTAPKKESLTGWEFNGYNLVWIASVLGIRKFKKAFYGQPNACSGYNIETRQSDFNEPWEYQRLKNGSLNKFGWFDVIYTAAADSHLKAIHPDAILLDYGAYERNGIFQGKLLRDYLVQVHTENPDLYLGKAYTEIGKALMFPAFFILKRAGKIEE